MVEKRYLAMAPKRPRQSTQRQQRHPELQAQAPTSLPSYQPPVFDFEDYGALKQKVESLEKTSDQHAESIKKLEHLVSWVKGATYIFGLLFVVFWGFIYWVIDTFKDQIIQIFQN